MSRFFQKLRKAINRQIPKDVKLSECEIRRLLGLLEVVKDDKVYQSAIIKAIHRLYAQIDLQNPCSCLKVSILLYDDDIEALKNLVNNHCSTIAEIYAESEGLMAYYAEKQYEVYTKLMLKIR
jgi:hypothetical protein